MRTIILGSALATLFLIHADVSAQGGPTQGQGPMQGRGPHYGSHYTAGWKLMTPAERDEHRKKMREVKTYDECRKIMDEHHKFMSERAKEKGATAPLPQPRRDGCKGLPK
ncbi:MAG: hypothetical protein ACRC2U_13710 [Aeromonas sp.]